MCSLLLLLLLLHSIMFSCEGRVLPHATSKDTVSYMQPLERNLVDGIAKDLDVKKDTASGVQRSVFMQWCHFGLPQASHAKIQSGQWGRALLGFESTQEIGRLKASRTAAELVTMDYPKAQRGPSIHNR